MGEREVRRILKHHATESLLRAPDGALLAFQADSGMRDSVIILLVAGYAFATDKDTLSVEGDGWAWSPGDSLVLYKHWKLEGPFTPGRKAKPNSTYIGHLNSALLTPHSPTGGQYLPSGASVMAPYNI